MFAKIRSWLGDDDVRRSEMQEVWKECPFSEHQWDPQAQQRPGHERVEWYCRVCKVGYTVDYVALGPRQVRIDVNTYPAEGQHTISRQVFRYFVLTVESTIQDLERQQGLAVVRGDNTTHTVPVGM